MNISQFWLYLPRQNVMLQRRSNMAGSISNKFLSIFLIIVKNYWKVKRPETEIEEFLQSNSSSDSLFLSHLSKIRVSTSSLPFSLLSFVFWLSLHALFLLLFFCLKWVCSDNCLEILIRNWLVYTVSWWMIDKGYF